MIVISLRTMTFSLLFTALTSTPVTATAGDVDYGAFDPANGIAQFDANEHTATIELDIINDGDVEPHEYLLVTFTVAGDGNFVGHLDCATVTIISEDADTAGVHKDIHNIF